MTTNPQITHFLDHLRKQAQDHAVELILSEDSSLLYPGSSLVYAAGFFVIQPRPTLAVGMGKPVEKWMDILVHESCHMDQWMEDSIHWKENFLDGREAIEWLNDWVEHKIELAREDLYDIVRRAKAVELDCERRTVEKMRLWKLPVDLAAYAQRANAYVHFYDIVAIRRDWNRADQAPYDLPNVWGQAPTYLADYPNEALAHAYRRQYFDA